MFWMPCEAEGIGNAYRYDPSAEVIESDRNLGRGVRQLPLESHCGLTEADLSLGDTLYSLSLFLQLRKR